MAALVDGPSSQTLSSARESRQRVVSSFFCNWVMVAGFGRHVSGASVTQPAQLGRHRHPRIAAHALHEQPDAPAALRRLAERAVDLARRDKGVGFRRPYPRDRLADVAVVTPEHGQMIIVVG